MKTAATGFDLWAEHRGSTYGLDKTDYGLGAGDAAMWLGGGFGVFSHFGGTQLRGGGCWTVVGWRLRRVFPLYLVLDWVVVAAVWLLVGGVGCFSQLAGTRRGVAGAALRFRSVVPVSVSLGGRLVGG